MKNLRLMPRYRKPFGQVACQALFSLAVLFAVTTCAAPQARQRRSEPLPPPRVTTPTPPRPRVAKSIHLALGMPRDSDPSDDLLIDHHVFILSYNSQRHDPNWVAWKMVAADIGAVKRRDDFHPDELLPDGLYRVTPADYRRSGFDRGHMCPSADRTALGTANSQTFVMTNMQPQRHALNAGPWEDLETFTRHLVRDQRKVVFVVSGGLFDTHPPTVGHQVAVPRANWKVVVVLDSSLEPVDAAAVTANTQVYAVIMPNKTAVHGTHWTDYRVAVDDVERQSGYDLLTEVAPAVQNLIEARVAGPP